MTAHTPRRLTAAERRARRNRVVRIARSFGFVGLAEYRHVYSQTGGAQYCRGSEAHDDLLCVYAEAFERDLDPDDFSLDAMVAHERGHQILVRHDRIARRVAGRMSLASEEILASLIGAMICSSDSDRDALMAKATFDLLGHGEALDVATHRLQELWELLERLL